jgi:ankyrin repeat protein
MARKKAQRKQETTLVPHRTPNLSALLERAKSGKSADAVRAFLDAGGSAVSLTQLKEGRHLVQLPLLHSMAVTNAHPRKELAECVRLLVAADADINTKNKGPDGDARTALMYAAERSCCKAVVAVLLQEGADACARSSLKHMTALHVTAMTASTTCCELLLARADTLLEAKDSNGVTPLLHACHTGRLDNAQLLLQHGADVNAVDEHGISGLMAAVELTSMPLVQLLLDSGANLSAKDGNGENVLFKAALTSNLHMMEMLVQRGLSITAVDNKGNTALVLAVSNRQRAAAEWLIQHGVAVNAVNEVGCAALHAVSANTCADDATMIELLLANGADVHQCAQGQLIALDLTASSGNVQCARALIAAGADVNHSNILKMTSLHTAIKEHQAAVAQVLLEHGATAVMNSVLPLKCVNGALCCFGLTALMMCTEADEVKLLLTAGADVHVTNSLGDTCLHVAAKHNWKAPLLCLLIKAGAKLRAVNNEGKRAAQIAHDRGYTLTEQLLKRAAQQV